MNSNSRSWKSNCCSDGVLPVDKPRPVRRCLAIVFALLLLPVTLFAQQSVSFPTADGGLIYAHEYGSGTHAVVLAHGGRRNKESWHEQAQALEVAGFRVLAFDFRGFGKSRGPGQMNPETAPLQLDVLAAISWLHEHGARKIDVVGASMGGSAAGAAIIASPRGLVHRLVLLGAAPDGDAAKLKCPSLFIVARDDANDDGPRLPGIRAQYARAPQPKRLVIVPGTAHAQFLFQTNQRQRVMREIMQFLLAP
ncbi:MAG: alpha/beta hydrolase [Steroidobacteraceae bacterium]